MNSDLASNWMAQAIVLQALHMLSSTELDRDLPTTQAQMILLSVLRHLLCQEADIEAHRRREAPIIRAYCTCCMKERKGVFIGHLNGWVCQKCGFFMLIDLAPV